MTLNSTDVAFAIRTIKSFITNNLKLTLDAKNHDRNKSHFVNIKETFYLFKHRPFQEQTEQITDRHKLTFASIEDSELLIRFSTHARVVQASNPRYKQLFCALIPFSCAGQLINIYDRIEILVSTRQIYIPYNSYFKKKFSQLKAASNAFVL